METAIQFTIQSLLERKEGKISGPMSPFLFAKEMAQEDGTKFNRLVRVSFADETMLQQREDDGLTGFDHLIIGTQYSDDLFLRFFVDMGVGGMPVAMCFQSDREIVIPPIYERTRFEGKITEPQIREIFEYIFEHPEVLDIREA